MLLVLAAPDADALLLAWIRIHSAVCVPPPAAQHTPSVPSVLAPLAWLMQLLDKSKRVTASSALPIHSALHLIMVETEQSLNGAQHAMLGGIVRNQRCHQRLKGELCMSAPSASMVIPTAVPIEIILLAMG